MDLLLPLVRAALALALVVLMTRLNGLRTFSKMSGFDFALTLAVGSTLASAVMASDWSQFAVIMAALAALYVLQFALTRARRSSEAVRDRIDNAPLLLVDRGEILNENLVRGQVTRADLMAKLREANALRLENVHAVVLETTGDVSVLHGQDGVDEALLEGVRR